MSISSADGMFEGVDEKPTDNQVRIAGFFEQIFSAQ